MKTDRTPCYRIDLSALKRNLEILRRVEEETGARVLLAQKAFSCFPLYPLIGQYLSGAAASGLYEARLSAEEMGKETHVFSAAFREEEFPEILRYADHVIMNSLTQLARFGPLARAAGKQIGLRLNPECSTQETAIYDPCAPGSRLGVTREAFDKGGGRDLLSLIDGLHFHTLCEQGAEPLEWTLRAVEDRFPDLLAHSKWINLGGGHHITKEGYDLPLLYRCIRRLQEKYGLLVYLEPGEAVALNAGTLRTRVLDIVENGEKTAILDTSAACHMPDVLEMPYRPPLKDSGEAGELPYTYILAGPTCLAGDRIGTYSFDHALSVGEILCFQDMAIYTMVKNNTFNGLPLPWIEVEEDGEVRVLREPGYLDFKGRLG